MEKLEADGSESLRKVEMRWGGGKKNAEEKNARRNSVLRRVGNSSYTQALTKKRREGEGIASLRKVQNKSKKGRSLQKKSGSHSGNITGTREFDKKGPEQLRRSSLL